MRGRRPRPRQRRPPQRCRTRRASPDPASPDPELRAVADAVQPAVGVGSGADGLADGRAAPAAPSRAIPAAAASSPAARSWAVPAPARRRAMPPSAVWASLSRWAHSHAGRQRGLPVWPSRNRRGRRRPRRRCQCRTDRPGSIKARACIVSKVTVLLSRGQRRILHGFGGRHRAVGRACKVKAGSPQIHGIGERRGPGLLGKRRRRGSIGFAGDQDKSQADHQQGGQRENGVPEIAPVVAGFLGVVVHNRPCCHGAGHPRAPLRPENR